jgi:hypothetical protein
VWLVDEREISASGMMIEKLAVEECVLGAVGILLPV